MNAYELADDLQECIDDGSTDLVCVQEAAILIRQQADRIAELEKEADRLSNHADELRKIHANRIAELEKQLYFKDYYEELPETPVGFLNRGERVARQMPPPEGLIDPKSYYIGYADGKKAPQTKCLDCGKVNPAEIHTCSPQTKLLSDEEISGIWEGLFENEDDIVHIHNFARAIEAKVRGEK